MSNEMARYKDAGLNLLASVADFISSFRPQPDPERIPLPIPNVVDNTSSRETVGESGAPVSDLNALVKKRDYISITIDEGVSPSSSVLSDSNNNRSLTTSGANGPVFSVTIDNYSEVKYFNSEVAVAVTDPSFTAGQCSSTSSVPNSTAVQAGTTLVTDMRTTVIQGYPKRQRSIFAQNEATVYAIRGVPPTNQHGSTETGTQQKYREFSDGTKVSENSQGSDLVSNSGVAYGGPLVGTTLTSGKKIAISLPDPNSDWPCPNPAVSDLNKLLPAHNETKSELPNVVEYGYWNSFPELPVGSKMASMEKVVAECYFEQVFLPMATRDPNKSVEKLGNAARTWARNRIEEKQTRQSLPLDLSPQAKTPIPLGSYNVLSVNISDDEFDDPLLNYGASAFAPAKSVDALIRVNGLLPPKPIYVHNRQPEKMEPFQGNYKRVVILKHSHVLNNQGAMTCQDPSQSADEELVQFVKDKITSKLTLKDKDDSDTD